MAFSPETVAARMEIQDVISRYSVHIDAGEFDRLQALFSDDAVFDITPDPVFMKVPVKGGRAIREALEARYRVVVKEAQRRHVMTNTIFDELGTDHAATRTFLTVLSVPKGSGGIELRGTGVYNDKFVCRNGVWQIRERYLVMDALGR